MKLISCGCSVELEVVGLVFILIWEIPMVPVDRAMVRPHVHGILQTDVCFATIKLISQPQQVLILQVTLTIKDEWVTNAHFRARSWAVICL